MLVPCESSASHKPPAVLLCKTWLDLGVRLQVGAALRAQFSAKYTSIEAVRVLIEDGKERLALIMAQEGLLKELQLSI